MLNFSLIGAGRIGNMHAKIIKAHPKSNLKYVYDVNSKLANDVVKLTGCAKAKSPEQAINSKDIDAVLIASATPTHTKFITTAAKAGKAVASLCSWHVLHVWHDLQRRNVFCPSSPA